jgi:outer membrane immunogenic protein
MRIIQHIFLVISAAAWSAGAAHATPAARVYDWTGFYIGGYAGHGWGQSDPSLTIANPTTQSFFGLANIPGVEGSLNSLTFKPEGFTGGGQIGYNHQLSPHLLFGVELDFGSLNLSESGRVAVRYVNNPIVPVQTRSISTDWVFTARPRFGFTSNNWLFYVTGGLAITEVKTSFTFSDTFFVGFVNGVGGQTKTGWTIGGGVEWAPWNGNWTLKAEYLHMDFGHVADTLTMSRSFAPIVVPPIFAYSADLKVDVLRIGLNYKFGPQ